MFFAVLFFQVLLKYFENKDDILGGASAFISIIGYVSARFIWMPFSIQAGMMSEFFIWIGYVIKKKNYLSFIKSYHYIVAFIFLMVGIRYGYCNVGFVVAYINDWIISIIIGLSGCLLIYWCSINYRGKILGYTGRKSLNVLCIHLYFLETMWIHTNELLDNLNLYGGYRACVLIIIGVVFSIAGVAFIDRGTSLLKSRPLKCKDISELCVMDRDVTSDVLKGIVIILLLIGDFSVNENFRKYIYSFHLIALILMAGYFHKKFCIRGG